MLWAAPFANVAGASLIGLQGQWVWETSEPAARLSVEPKPGREPETDFQVLLFVTLKARGRLVLPPKVTKRDAGAWLEIERGVRWGHEIIVSAFDSLTVARHPERLRP